MRELTPIELECNMGKDANGVEHREPWKAYDIDEVDSAIAELKRENAELKDEIKRLENVRKVHIESIESMCEGLKLNAKQICKTQRALWLARAERAKEMCQRLLIQGFDPKWEEVERKCRAKAEEYK